MSPGKLLCIECGKPLSDDEESMVCHDCRDKQIEEKEDLLVLPESVTVTVCGKCGAHKHGKSWKAPQILERTIEDELRSSVVPSQGVLIKELSVSPCQRTKKQFPCVISGNFEYEGKEIKRDYRLLALVKYEVCEVCSRKYGNYFEAILQLRRERSLTEGQLEELEAKVLDFVEKEKERDWHCFVTRVEEVHGGLDFFLSSSSLAQKLSTFLLNSLGGETKTSSSLVGRREGRNLYRSTYCLRFPPVEVGDVVQWESPHHKEKKVYLVKTVSRRGSQVVDLHTHELEFLDKRHFNEVTRSTREKVDFDAIVLFSERSEFRIMDPETYQSVTLLKPSPSFEVEDGETIPILKTDFGIFVDVEI